MKRILALIVVLAMSLSFCACGKSEKAKEVDELIESIGKVTLDSEKKIAEAEKAVEELDEDDVKHLDNLTMLEEARNEYDNLVCKKEASTIDELITSIGEVSIENKEAVYSARTAYDEADKNVQKKVEKLSVLENAEDTLNALLVSEVETMIEEIGDVEIEDVETIAKARELYAALSPENATKIKNINELNAAEIAIKQVEDEYVQKMLSNMRLEEDKVRGLKFYYSKTQPYYADVRCYIMPYIGVDGTHSWLCARYHYTGDDWVFFKKITFAVDGTNYYKYYNYNDLIRDNAYGDVWEYVNTADVSDSDVELFLAIANSNETIVRFEGDEYYYDFTVPAKDKQAIKEVLTTYNAMQWDTFGEN